MKTDIRRVCSLEGDELDRRAQAWTAVRKQALRSAVSTEAGARFEYAASPELEAELGRLVRAERDCCSVAGIQWALDKHEDRLIVNVTTPASLRDSPEAKLIFAVIGGA